MRTSYGFRTFRITEVARYHALAKLPELELTHHFSDESFYNLVDSKLLIGIEISAGNKSFNMIRTARLPIRKPADH
jgi:hypothetical protein